MYRFEETSIIDGVDVVVYKFPSHLQVQTWTNRYNLLLKAIIKKLP